MTVIFYKCLINSGIIQTKVKPSDQEKGSQAGTPKNDEFFQCWVRPILPRITSIKMPYK